MTNSQNEWDDDVSRFDIKASTAIECVSAIRARGEKEKQG
jgi:hypothetical protein